MPAPLWDVFCHVVDNHGDLGVCWRLSRQLAARGAAVRLWVDDAHALAWMAPHGCPGVDVRPWAQAATADGAACAAASDVVLETFGCDLPSAWLAAMAASPRRPAWINLEYLSAEGYVERSHRLPSPQWSGPAAGCVRHYFYPGFTPSTGGLLREPGLDERRQAFDGDRWLRDRGWLAHPAARRVSVFCYPAAPLGALLARLAAELTVLMVPPIAALDEIRSLARGHPTLRVQPLPWLTQDDYDHLLWACGLNLVRGEDSAVRAMWARRPFLWQLYPQDDGAHAAKLDAFLQRLGSATRAGPVVEAAMRAWNGLAAWPDALPAPPAWARACVAWGEHLALQVDLASQLLAFAGGLRTGADPTA